MLWQNPPSKLGRTRKATEKTVSYKNDVLRCTFRPPLARDASTGTRNVHRRLGLLWPIGALLSEASQPLLVLSSGRGACSASLSKRCLWVACGNLSPALSKKLSKRLGVLSSGRGACSASLSKRCLWVACGNLSPALSKYRAGLPAGAATFRRIG